LRGGADVIAERLRDKPIEAQFRRVAEDRQTDGHAIMSGFRLRPVGPERAIPPGKIETKIAIGLVAPDRMVHAVHVRRHHDEAHGPVEP
jgi:hypothetical protein